MAGCIITVVHAFLGGLVFALTYVKTKSLLPAVIAHISGNISSYVPMATKSLPVTIQYVIAIVFLTVTILFCTILTLKKEDL